MKLTKQMLKRQAEISKFLPKPQMITGDLKFEKWPKGIRKMITNDGVVITRVNP